MKVIIAGGRDRLISPAGLRRLDEFHHLTPITEVVCGMAPGIDTAGKAWADLRKIPVAKFPADWDKYGPKAGPIRNNEMALYGDALIAFDGGSGTANMIKRATVHRLLIWDWRSEASFVLSRPKYSRRGY